MPEALTERTSAAVLRDLSLGGCRLDTTFPMESGARAEIIVRVNGASFRAVGEVRAVPGGWGACIEFVRWSAGRKYMLGEVIAELERVQAVMNKLKAASAEIDPELLRREPENGAMLREGLRLRATTLTGEPRKTKLQVTSAGRDSIADAQALVFKVD